MNPNKSKITQQIKDKAEELGFLGVGISKAQKAYEKEEKLTNWLDKGYHGTMDYMEKNLEKRLDPTKLVPNSKSVISFMYNYYTDVEFDNDSAFKISKYAYGRDYHKVVKNKLKKLFSYINDNICKIEGRIFVDSAPVLERYWAEKSGLGWIGKNGLLISPKIGSYFFLAEIIIDLELEYDEPISLNCGKCRRCIDACPTSAIAKEGYILDANKCISFQTIENTGEIPENLKDKMQNYIFGCDICQDVCPWNRYAQKHNEPDFEPKEKLHNLTKEDWHNLTEKEFQELFFGTPVKRAKYDGLKRNINFVAKNNSNKND